MAKQEKPEPLAVVYKTALGSVTFYVNSFTRKEFETLARKYRRPVTVAGKRTTEMEIDDELYYPALYRAIIDSYEGLTAAIKALICREPKPDNPSEVIPFDRKIMLKMARTSPQLSEQLESAAVNYESILGELRAAELNLDEEVLDVEVPN